MANPLTRLLLGEGRKNEQVVDAPAFSLTKVLVVSMPVITVVVAGSRFEETLNVP